MVLFIGAASDLPDASEFELPITVESPMSLRVIVIGAPVLILSVESSEKLRHSGPWSTLFSLTTKPQLLHDSSPVVESSTSVLLPQLGHLPETWSAEVLIDPMLARL
jgi:hypothetical protein